MTKRSEIPSPRFFSCAHKRSPRARTINRVGLGDIVFVAMASTLSPPLVGRVQGRPRKKSRHKTIRTVESPGDADATPKKKSLTGGISANAWLAHVPAVPARTCTGGTMHPPPLGSDVNGGGCSGHTRQSHLMLSRETVSSSDMIHRSQSAPGRKGQDDQLALAIDVNINISLTQGSIPNIRESVSERMSEVTQIAARFGQSVRHHGDVELNNHRTIRPSFALRPLALALPPLAFSRVSSLPVLDMRPQAPGFYAGPRHRHGFQYSSTSYYSAHRDSLAFCPIFVQSNTIVNRGGLWISPTYTLLTLSDRIATKLQPPGAEERPISEKGISSTQGLDPIQLPLSVNPQFKWDTKRHMTPPPDTERSYPGVCLETAILIAGPDAERVRTSGKKEEQWKSEALTVLQSRLWHLMTSVPDLVGPDVWLRDPKEARQLGKPPEKKSTANVLRSASSQLRLTARDRVPDEIGQPASWQGPLIHWCPDHERINPQNANLMNSVNCRRNTEVVPRPASGGARPSRYSKAKAMMWKEIVQPWGVV
ncbi:hypothetical protein BC826DRAFT_1179023 [Russula brevipes]|nr:hypothetical protein BC826DRAFT_1179023 [Russula brevipes]